MYKAIELSVDEAVATVWMNRPERHNAFDLPLIGELHAAFAELGEDDAVRVVVLAGRGRSFSAGADVEWMRAAGEAPIRDNVAEAMQMAAMLRAVAECPKPVLARVQGAAIGGGLGLACASDICVAGERAVFAASETRLGLIPSTIGPYVLRAIGARQAGRWFLSGERIPAARAQTLGLVHELAADDALDAAVDAMVAALLEGGPAAQAHAKALLSAIAHRPLDDALQEETAERIALLRASEEAAEGLSAFLEKRPPRWRGGG